MKHLMNLYYNNIIKIYHLIVQAIFQYKFHLFLDLLNKILIDKNIHQDFHYYEMELINK